MSVDSDSQRYGQSLEGQQFQLANAEERKKVIELAFDYRGDVTLELQSGERLEGFVFDRNRESPSPSLKLFPKNQAGTREVGYEHVVSIVFSGEDTASGKSWEEWLNKKQKVSGKNHSS